ncbi:hypothetical protein, conserved [Eimeria maxima]|uniref:Mob1/phocein family protein n=1 Tax=Eimeria maxima TaxID=5804 RepID=U6MG27_EIMMA|nr:hypothetical protein, conserved [Eimeria maxima]CDJ60585.1 hypothetical protein, conserved [Eimeria maxima]
MEASSSFEETQRLLLWSASPSLLAAKGTSSPSVPVTTGGSPASPSAALLHSLGDEGLRSALHPPGIVATADWLRYLLFQAVEDAQLLFSSLLDECECSALGLPEDTRNAGNEGNEKQTDRNTNFPQTPTAAATHVLDPPIAFAVAPEKSAPHRRLNRSETAASPSVRPAAEPAEAAATAGENDEGREGCAATGAAVPGSLMESEESSTCTEINKAGTGDTETNSKRDEEAETKDSATNIEQAGADNAQAPPTAREYISTTMSWAFKQLESPRLFPFSPTATAAEAEAGAAEDAARRQPPITGANQDKNEEEEEKELRQTAALIVRRLLRCYAHIYLYHLPLLQQYDAVASANHCLKKLMFLSVDGGLIERGGPLKSLERAWLDAAQPEASLRCTDTKDTPQTAGHRETNDQRTARAAHAEAQWLLPALQNAELCLGAIEGEEFPTTGRN